VRIPVTLTVAEDLQQKIDAVDDGIPRGSERRRLVGALALVCAAWLYDRFAERDLLQNAGPAGLDSGNPWFS